MPLPRRSFFKHSLTAATGLSLANAAIAAVADEAAKPDGLIVRSRRPLDLETPIDRLGDEFTPTEWFFVRSHHGEPPVRTAGWSIACDGLFAAPQTFDLRGLFASFPRVERPAVCMCAGNGRGLFEPRIPGLPWERGAVGQALWSGIRLRDVLERLGPTAMAKHIVFEGADLPPTPQTPAFIRSLPIERALEADVLLADRMNGVPLPVVHGGPVRVVVPTWTANHWMKWVRRITASDEEAPGMYQRTGYKMPDVPLPPDVPPTPAQMKPVTALNVKSLITWPLAGARLARGRHVVRGLAWTGTGTIQDVAVRIRADAAFVAATITTADRIPGAWVRFEAPIDLPAAGDYAIASRATDTGGNAQPAAAVWNKSGYLYNAIDPVPVRVT